MSTKSGMISANRTSGKVGRDCTFFKPGDEVYYAGSLIRPGCNSEFHLVDERIVGKKPSTLDFANAASLPLTTITAWESLRSDLRGKIGAGCFYEHTGVPLTTYWVYSIAVGVLAEPVLRSGNKRRYRARRGATPNNRSKSTMPC